jgi:unsaturated rhamnogalacturonyl hydrolase
MTFLPRLSLFARKSLIVCAAIACLLVSTAWSAPAAAPAASARLGDAGWDDLPAILARIKAPEFPDRDFSVLDFGAVAGGEVDATESIRRAIEACHAAGGGRVIVPAGVFLTGAIHLKSNVNLHLVEGATLRFSGDPEKYLPVVRTRWEGIELMNYSPLVYAYEQENIAITGKGVLDGAANEQTWWRWARRFPGGGAALQVESRNRLVAQGEAGVPVAERVYGPAGYLRPSMIQPYRCRNVLIEGVIVLNSPMWHLNPVLCTNVTIRGVSINGHGPNNDGCNPESSRDVLIEDCHFDTGDDCIAIKSGRNNDGRRVGVASENIVIRNSTMKDGHGGVVVGSEISGGCRNVFVENCEMDSPNLDRGLRFKTNARRGGLIENIFMRNVRIGRVSEAVLTIDLWYEEGARGDFPPVIRNVVMENIESRASPRVLFVRGFPAATIDGLRIANSTFRGVAATEVLNHTGRVVFENVTIEPAVAVNSLNSVPAPSL